MDKITYKGVTFKGKRFGYNPGCWWVSTKAATKIAKLCGIELPRIGYDKSLTNNNQFRERITNHSGCYRITLDDYEKYHIIYNLQEV